MNRTITTAFHQPNNNNDIPDDDANNDDANNDTAPERIAPTMHVQITTPHPMGPAGYSEATAIQILGPTSQPILVSRGQATMAQQAPVSTQESSIQDANVNLADENGQTRLMLAARFGDLPTVLALLSNGADINATDDDDQTALMFATKCGHLKVVRALLNVPGIDINATSFNGITALHMAADLGEDDMVHALIEKGANVNITSSDGWTPLMFAAEYSHLTVVQALLNAPGIDINAKDIQQQTALYFAAARGKGDIAEALLANGADIDHILEDIKDAFDALDDQSDPDSDDEGDRKARSACLDLLMNYLAQRQANAGNLHEEATWASAFATWPITPNADTIPSLQSLAIDTLIEQSQLGGPSLAQISFQVVRDQLLKQELSATQVVTLIYTISSTRLATALVQTLAIAIQLGGYCTDSEHQLIHNALRTSRLIDAYEKSKSHLSPDNINRWQVSGQTFLTRAAQAGDQILVNALITCGAAYHLPDQHGNNALHAAVKARQWSVCSYLLARGANPNTSDRSGVYTLTYLAKAFAEGDEETAVIVAKLIAPLLAKGYRLDRVIQDFEAPELDSLETTILEILQSDLDRYFLYLDLLYADNIDLAYGRGQTPLMFAAKHGHLPTLQRLIEKGASVNITDNHGMTPLISAAGRGHLTTVQALLSAPGIDINANSLIAATALHMAARLGKDEVVKALINKGANINITDNAGVTPLMSAAGRGHLTTVQTLLSVPGIDINAKSFIGKTALHMAADYGKDEVVKTLINRGANINITDNDGLTPLMSATLLGHLTTVQALLSAPGIDINAKSLIGKTALQTAADYGKYEFVKALINKGANINITDNAGVTPLISAAGWGHLTTVQALLSVPGIDMNAKSLMGATALHMAARFGKDEVVKALINKGANVNITDNVGMTPLMTATLQGHLTTIQALSSI